MAEIYQIYEYRKLPLRIVSTLAMGLLDTESRVRRKVLKMNMPTDTYLLSAITDRLTLLLYSMSSDASKGKNYPELILGDREEEKDDIVSFDSGEAFMKQRENLLGRRESGD